MDRFNCKQYKKDIDYIADTYMKKASAITKYTEFLDEYVYRYVNYDDMLYKMYKFRDVNKIGFLLVPAKIDLFKNDFNDIIRFYADDNGINLSIINRKDKVVNTTQYEFEIQSDGSIFSKTFVYSKDDSNNELFNDYTKSQLLVEGYILNDDYLKGSTVTDVSYVKRNSEKTVGYRVENLDANNIMNSGYQFYTGQNYQYELDNNSSLIELHKSLLDSKIKVK